jgi:ribose transport system permease protein
VQNNPSSQTLPAHDTGVQGTLKRVGRWLVMTQEGVLLLIIIAICIFLSSKSPVFMTGRNIGVLLSVVSMTAISAYGMTMLMISGEVDLSVGSLQAVVGVVVMLILNSTHNLALGIVVGLAIGAVVGLVNAAATLGLGINSLIVTLAMLNILRGLGYLITQAAVQNFHKLPSFARLGNGFLAKQGQGVLGFIPLPVVYMIVIFIVIWLVMARTTFGRYVYAVGGNRRAAALSGIRTKLIKTVAFVVMGVLGAVSGIILLSRMNSGQNNAGFGFELQVVAAALLGGTGLGGGAGSLVGTLLAVLLLAILNNGIILLGIHSNWQMIMNGALILLAIFLDARRRHAAGLE